MGSSSAFSLKEDPVRCAKVCDESWVILKYVLRNTVKLGDTKWFDKEQIGVKEPFPVTNCQFTS